MNKELAHHLSRRIVADILVALGVDFPKVQAAIERQRQELVNRFIREAEARVAALLVKTGNPVVEVEVTT